MAMIATHSDQLAEMLKLRESDSLQKISLEKQISLLKASEHKKRQELLEQIEALNSRDSIRIAKLKHRIDSLRLIVKGFPVVPFPGDTLFRIFNKVGSFTPSERARAISIRIRKLADEWPFSADSVRLENSDLTTDITCNGTILMSVTEKDAIWMNTSKSKLATQYRLRICKSVVSYMDVTSFDSIIKKVGIAVLIITLLAVFIFLVSKLFRWIKGRINRYAGNHIKVIKLKDYELFDVQRQMKVLMFLTTVAQWWIILLSVYFTLPIIFGLFPWTKNLAGVLLGYVLNPLVTILKGIWGYLPNLFTIIVIVVVFTYVLKGFKFLKGEVEREALRIPGLYPDLANPTFQIIRVLTYAFMLVVIFPYLPGANSPVFQGVSVFLGVLFTFGSTGSLSNMIAGLVITFMRSYKVGDRVKIGDVTGDIIEKSILVTRMRTIKNELISIPNSNVLGSHLINYSSDAPGRGLIINTTITIGYDAPWRQVHQLMIDAALATDLIEKEPKPFVFQTSLDDFFVSYQINAYTRAPNDQASIYSQLHQNLQDKFNEAGVEIMSPHYYAGRDGNKPAMPERQ